MILDSSDIDLWNIDLLDTYKFRFVRYRYPHFFLFPRRLEDIFKTCLQDVFKTCLQDMSSRRLQRNNFSSSDAFKTSSRPLGRRKIVTLKTCWSLLQDQQIFSGMTLTPVLLSHWIKACANNFAFGVTTGM